MLPLVLEKKFNHSLSSSCKTPAGIAFTSLLCRTGEFSMKTIVPVAWNVPAKIRERFGDSAGRQRAMSADGHLLLILHEPPGANDRSRRARLFWRDPAGKWAWTTNGNTSQLLKEHITEFTERVDRLENQLTSACCADDYFRILQAVAPLHRTGRNLHTTLQQARELFPDDRSIIAARDAAGDIERSLELLHTDAKNGLDYTVAQRTELQSQQSHDMAVSAHRLNVLAALFFPITAISSVFGMNIKNGLESFPDMWLFWGVLAAGFLSGLWLARIIVSRPASLESPTKKVALKKRSTPSKPAKPNRKLQPTLYL